jgi:hypothetical protein
MLSMESDPKPDRDGYMDFKTSIENGNTDLQNRAVDEFNQQREQHPDRLTTTLACYMDMHIIEKLKDRVHSDDPNEIARDSEKRLGFVRDRLIRQQGINRINRLLDVWAKGRDMWDMNHIERYEFDLKRGIEKRQSENPGETKGQSWFHARRGMENNYVNFQISRKMHLDRAIDKVVHYARVREARALAEQLQYVQKLKEREKQNRDRER